MTEVLMLYAVRSLVLRAPGPSSSKIHKSILLLFSHTSCCILKALSFYLHPESFQLLPYCPLLLSSRKGFKLVILDEADAMTQDAQNALRRGKPSVQPGVAHWAVRLTVGSQTIWLLVNYRKSACTPRNQFWRQFLLKAFVFKYWKLCGIIWRQLIISLC